MEEQNKVPEEQNIEESKEEVREQDNSVPENVGASDPVAETPVTKAPKLKPPLIIGGLVTGVAAVAVAVALVLGGGNSNQNANGKPGGDNILGDNDHEHSFDEWKPGGDNNLDDNDHEHSFGEWNLVTNATCVANGKEERVCDCGEKESRTINALGHKEVVDNAVDPTCTATGLTEGKHCSICNKVIVAQNIIDPYHEYGDTYIYDATHHWNNCIICTSNSAKIEHILNDDGICVECNQPILDTNGVIYEIPTGATVATVMGYSGTATKVKIADTYCGLPVTTIYAEAFRRLPITTVIIPNTVTTIQDKAFQGCEKLTSITIPDSVAHIGIDAFSYCRALTSVVIGDSVSMIGKSAFRGCSNLKSVTIGSNVRYIDEYAFADCNETTSVYIKDMTAWCSIYFYHAESNPLYTWRYSGHNNYAGNLYLNGELVTNLVIPDDVTSISSHAFQNCYSLTSVIIPNSVIDIKRMAFSKCISLTDVTLGNGTNVNIISDDAFSGCDNLKKEYNLCTYIGTTDNPYLILLTANNKNLSTYEIHKDTQIIAGDAFKGCKNLKSVTISENIRRIGASAFYGCNIFETVYFKGTQIEWSSIVIGSNNNKLINATFYYYSEFPPTDIGNFWHFIDGAPTKWND